MVFIKSCMRLGDGKQRVFCTKSVPQRKLCIALPLLHFKHFAFCVLVCAIRIGIQRRRHAGMVQSSIKNFL
jgi:hypothetical protein